MKTMLSLAVAGLLTIASVGCQPAGEEGVEPVDGTTPETSTDTTGEGTTSDSATDSTDSTTPADAASDAGDVVPE